jgi:spectinomycin phosphotransferase
MLEKPDIQDDQLIACLQAAYGLQIAHFTFLPLGGDLSTAVYRVVTDDQTPYFCKLKRGDFDETSVALPNFLSKQGIAQIIPPLPTQTGQLWAVLGEFKLILYPFVEGTSGYEVELTERQWADFGAALKRLHTVIVPPALALTIQTERYDPEWRERCKQIIKRLDKETFDEPVTIAWAAFMRSQRETVLALIERAEQLAHRMASRSMEFVLCHSDIHPGNLLIDTRGTLFLVDWDYPLLAPKERDLMFIGGGQGFMPYSAEREETLFYRGYGQAALDPIALPYYRYERSITDIAVESERVLSRTLGSQDRAQALEYLQFYFLPGCTFEMAYQADKTRYM